MRLSIPSFAVGFTCAAVLVAIPTYAAVVVSDQNPTVFDGTSPVLTVQPVQFILGRTINAAGPTGVGAVPGESSDEDSCAWYNYAPVRLQWSATDATSGVKSFDVLTRNVDEGMDPHVDTAQTGATSMDITATNYDDSCGGGFGWTDWWVTARDFRGFTSTSPMTSDYMQAWDEDGINWPDNWLDESTTNLPVVRTGTWSTSNCTCHNHGKTIYASSTGASITYTVSISRLATQGMPSSSGPGRALAVVAPMSSNRGVMNISVDGGAPTKVNTYAATTTNRVIVWQKVLNIGTHTIKISPAGTAGHPRIDVDTLMLGPTWSGEAPPSDPTPID